MLEEIFRAFEFDALLALYEADKKKNFDAALKNRIYPYD